MKTFVKENWYKLMVGTSMLMVSFGFMIYAISPAYSNSENNTSSSPITPQGTNGVILDDYAYFVDGGYVYSIETRWINHFAGFDDVWGSLSNGVIKWAGSDFKVKEETVGKKTKLP